MPTKSRKLLVVLIGLLVLGFVVYRSSGVIHLGDFSGTKLLHAARHANPFLLILSIIAIYSCYALRALRWKVFQQNLGPSHFATIYAMTLAGFSAVFLLGRAGEPVRPLLLARKEKLPVSGMFGIYVLERLFDTASAAVIAAIGLLLFESRAHPGETAGKLETAAKTTGSLLFVGVVAAIAFLLYLRLHGTVLLERRLEGWAVQLPGVGCGSQVASCLAYTTVFRVEKEAAAAASIVMWLISFAACSLAGVPLLIHEGFSLGKLRQMAEHEKEAASENVNEQGESAQ